MSKLVPLKKNKQKKMGCFRSKSSTTWHPMQPPTTEPSPSYPDNENLKQELLIHIPGCTVHLMDEGEAMVLTNGEFKLVRVLNDDVPLATIVKVGEDLQWPLTKDEPVVKLGSFHYLFSLPMKDGNPLSYGVSFTGRFDGRSSSLDSLLKEHSCFSGETSTGEKHVDWKEYAPRVEDYNNVLAKAIAGGSGQIVKGIFKCSNSYTNQVKRGGETILMQAPPASKNGCKRKSNGASKSLKRVRKLSKMTEKMSKAMVGMVGGASGTVMAPLVNSKPGKAFLSMVPGQVLLASLDAVNKVIDAAEAAEKQAFSATSSAATRMMTDRFGERAGEATEDVLASAGHCASAVWNIFKIRKAMAPTKTATSGRKR
ncbi:senescence/dehydration-associated protein At4g35985, chloroplastic-like isoform X2 [Hibiscus syriacus]|uniref:senescence/dehydration-associated protein At4g35985, chloroplastic-like isoform X2 n=1 Tax=Hibiscus syriacus TaxID=106335 RepID=UPI00192199F5|nr:senescence/dehydration-associated protein At4g35985, chloroplastic-like isoform X2 [Hibiscus syriacus]